LTGTSATFSINQNADTIVSVSNTTAGTTSQAYFQATSDTTAGYTSFGKASSSFTAYKILTASSGYIYNSKGDISILNDASTGTIKMAAGGSSTAHLTISSAGNVGIGTSSPAAKLDVVSSGRVFNFGTSATTTGNFYGALVYNGSDIALLGNGPSIVSGAAAIDFAISTGNASANMIFAMNNTERMRITSGGDVCVGTTTAGFTAVGRGNITIGGPSTSILSLKPGSADGGYMYHASTSLSINNNSSGGIYMTALSAGVVLSNGATAWASSSDERLKNINSNIENALDKLLSLRAVNFNWKSDDTKKEVLGLIAQDVDKVFPQVVDKSKLPFDINGERTDETEYLNIRYTELVPVLVRAIQELSTDLTSAKQEIELLKLK
jgi:hypothetical protein